MRDQTPWVAAIRKGDVLKSPGGVLRVVRKVKHGRSDRRTHITFSILHCSWTRRPTTTYNAGELKALGYRPTAFKGYPLKSKLDKAIERELGGRDGSHRLLGADREIFCCDVKGIT